MPEKPKDHTQYVLSRQDLSLLHDIVAFEKHPVYKFYCNSIIAPRYADAGNLILERSLDKIRSEKMRDELIWYNGIWTGLKEIQLLIKKAKKEIEKREQKQAIDQKLAAAKETT